METMASIWACDPCGLSDLGDESSVWGSQCDVDSSPPAGLMWTEQLSPHLQRNKQLQDTLLQREEQLAKLQDENNKLRQFLNSSFVRNLEQKTKKLTSDGRRKLKRNLMYADDGHVQNRSHDLLTSQQVSKRVCRNLTAEFCSDSSETSPNSEPNLDLWVLRTLGLKDRDTIDTSSDSSSGFRSLVSEYSSSFSPSVPTSTPSSVHSYCQRPSQPTDYSYSPAHGANHSDPAQSPQTCTASPHQHHDFTATELRGRYEPPETLITTTAFQTTPLTQELPCTQSPGRPGISPVQTLEGNPAKHPSYWSPTQDTVQFSPGQRVPFSPISSSTPVMNQMWTPVCGGCPTSPSAGSLPPATPQTPRSRTDLAFSMSLSPSNSVKTHSFPQGQAFVRRTEGRWNFTWVPRQGP